MEESETEMEQDDPVEADVDIHTREHLVSRLRSLLNDCLMASEFTDAGDVQQLILQSLSAGDPNQPLTAVQHFNLLRFVTQRLQIRMDRARNHSRSRMASVFMTYVSEFEAQLGVS